MFIQHVASELGLQRISTMKSLEVRLNPLMKANKFRCVFVVTNAEELAGFNSLLLHQFLRFILTVILMEFQKLNVSFRTLKI